MLCVEKGCAIPTPTRHPINVLSFLSPVFLFVLPLVHGPSSSHLPPVHHQSWNLSVHLSTHCPFTCPRHPYIYLSTNSLIMFVYSPSFLPWVVSARLSIHTEGLLLPCASLFFLISGWKCINLATFYSFFPISLCSLSINPSAYHPSILPSIYPPTHPSAHPPIHPFIHSLVHLSECLSTHPCITCPYTYPIIYPFILSSLHPSTCLPILSSS